MAKKLTPELAMQLKRKGWKNREIAADFGVSDQHVHNQLVKDGYVSPKNVVEEVLPWDVPQEFRRNDIFRRLWWHGTSQVEFGHVGEDSQRRLDDLIEFMRTTDTVIDFDPSYPPFKAFTYKPGFQLVPREDADREAGNYIVKIRPGTRLEGLGKQLWRMPSD